MNRCNQIYSKIWCDLKFKKLKEQEKILFIYILTSSHINIIGFYHLPLEYISCDLNWSKSTVLNNIISLQKHKFIEYDLKNEIVFIINYLKYNNEHFSNPINIKKIYKYFIDFPDTYLFYCLQQSFKKYLNNHFTTFLNIVSNFDNYNKGLKNFNKINKKQNLDNLLFEESLVDNTNKIETEEDILNTKFEEFFNCYPRKESKTVAKKNFIKIVKNKKNNITSDMLIESAKRYNAFCLSNNRELEYIKLPSTFLGKDEHYKDYLIKNINTNCLSNNNLIDNYSSPI